jgi:site-specific recombinase XerD
VSHDVQLVPVTPVYSQPTVPAPPPQAGSDEQLIHLWLRTKGDSTRVGYVADVLQFTSFVDKPLRLITLQDALDYRDHLAELRIGPEGRERPLARSTQARKIAVVKSLFSFASKVGYVAFNVGAAVAAPKHQNRLAERILPESPLQRMIALEPNGRNRALIRLAYASGGRVSEICGLTTRDVQLRTDPRSGREAAQITVFGKGGKTRAIPFSPDTWAELKPVLVFDDPNAPLFRSRKGGGPLSRSQVLRIVRRAALRAGIDANVSPHWLRHAHASHALDRGAPLPLVRDTLGHASIATTNKYAHARPGESSSRFLGV